MEMVKTCAVHVPLGLKPSVMTGVNRSAEALRHPKACWGLLSSGRSRPGEEGSLAFASRESFPVHTEDQRLGVGLDEGKVWGCASGFETRVRRVKVSGY